jgi:hypothetical protein
MTDPTIPEEQEVDRVTVLDRTLDESLAEFDAMLLIEMERIKKRSAERMSDLSDEATEVARRLKEKGIDLDMKEVSESTTESERETGESETEMDSGQRGREEDIESTESGSEQRSEDAGPGGEERSGGKQTRTVEDETDDDIVARQLREAAEKETDPELKEKLWKEYEDYKRGQP